LFAVEEGQAILSFIYGVRFSPELVDISSLTSLVTPGDATYEDLKKQAHALAKARLEPYSLTNAPLQFQKVMTRSSERMHTVDPPFSSA
jgi:hypothetical protein